MKKALLTLAIVAVATVATRAQSVIAWDVSGDSSPATLTADGGIDPNLVTTTGFNTLSRVTLGDNAGANSYNSNNWNITNTFSQSTNYITFTLQPQSGFQVNLTSLDYAINGSNTAPGMGQWGYSTDGGVTFTLQSTFALTNPQPSALATWNFTDFSSTSAVEFRFWAFGATSINGGTATTSGTVRVANIAGNDLVLNGSVVSAIPEPTTIGLISLGLVGVVAFARRRKV
jgi:PEP-CTERM motif-containing protein